MSKHTSIRESGTHDQGSSLRALKIERLMSYHLWFFLSALLLVVSFVLWFSLGKWQASTSGVLIGLAGWMANVGWNDLRTRRLMIQAFLAEVEAAQRTLVGVLGYCTDLLEQNRPCGMVKPARSRTAFDAFAKDLALLEEPLPRHLNLFYGHIERVRQFAENAARRKTRHRDGLRFAQHLCHGLLITIALKRELDDASRRWCFLIRSKCCGDIWPRGEYEFYGHFVRWESERTDLDRLCACLEATTRCLRDDTDKCVGNLEAPDMILSNTARLARRFCNSLTADPEMLASAIRKAEDHDMALRQAGSATR